MKKALILLICFCFLIKVQSQVSKTIDVVTPGTLSTLLTVEEKSTITDLTVTGDIDARDIKYIRDAIWGRTRIDLSNVNIQAYSGLGGTINAYEQGSDSYAEYPANTLPVNAFYRYKTVASAVYVINQNINTVILPKSLTTIGSNAFKSSYSLKYIDLASVSVIDNYAFYNCSNLISLNIPTTVSRIGISAFANCGRLTLVIIPNSNINIESAAFASCSGLITVDENNPNYVNTDSVLFTKDHTVLLHCSTTKKGTYRIPSTVTGIDDYAFQGCLLNTIIIPTSVKNIGNAAFIGWKTPMGDYTTYLRYIKVESEIPLDLSDKTSVFQGGEYDCKLYVPSGSKSAYQAANQWKNFTNIFEYTTAMPSVIDEKVKIYPSVVTDGFRISGFDNFIKITLYDINGKELLSKSVTENEFVSLGSLSQGIYIVKIMTKEGIIGRRIVKM